MKIKRIIEHLQSGVLSKVNLGGNTEMGITSYNYPAVISAIELGLVELSQYFNLQQREVFIKQEDHIKVYELDVRYAQTNTASTETYKYIKDTVDNPFTGDILRIESIYDELGHEFKLNDDSDPDSLYTPSLISVQVPRPNAENTISVIYSAGARELNKTGSDVLEQEVYLPQVLLQAMLMFVAAQVVLGKDSLEAKNESMVFERKFKEAVALAMNYGANVKDSTANTNVERNKWA
jgi:hypothetical protein